MGLFRKLTSVSTLGLVDYRSDKERIARNTKKGYKATQAQTRAMTAGMGAQIAQGAEQSAMIAAQLDYQRRIFLQTPDGQAQLAFAQGQLAACEDAWRHANGMATQAQTYRDALRASGTASRQQLRDAQAGLHGWIAERDRIAGTVHAARMNLRQLTG